MKYKGLLFKNRKFDFDKLVHFGFKLTNKAYVYNTNILENSFELIVKRSSEEDIDTKLIELATGEDYNLIFVKSTEG